MVSYSVKKRYSKAIILATSLLASLTATTAASADVSDQVMPQGVVVEGVDLSGLVVKQAGEQLEAQLDEHLLRDAVITLGRREFRLTAKQAKLNFDGLKTAKRAYYSAVKQAPPQGSDPNNTVSIELAVSFSKQSVKQFSQAAAAKVYRAPRNAKVKITVRRLKTTKSRNGLYVKSDQVARALNGALAKPNSTRVFKYRLRKSRASVTVNDLKRSHATVVTVSRSTFKLRLFKRLKWKKTYGIAVGMAGLETPTGLFNIQNKQVNPAWHVPNSDWAGDLAGQVIPGGAPNNPLKARWLGVTASVGIHGTSEEWSIGSKASHGCIRMRVSDVKDLYSRVPVGTRILIQ